MLKRVTKVTSLLAVAASVISIVPAMAATDVKKVEAQDGTVYIATAKGNGLFIIDGDINGKGEDAVYYVADGKYNELKNANSGDADGELFQNKYVEFDDGDYYIDPVTGNKIEEKLSENWHDDITTAVRKKIKEDNDGRFNAALSYDNTRIDAIKQWNGQQCFVGFSSVWGEFRYPLKTTNVNGITYSTIYSDADGKYVDTDYNLGTFNVATTGASVSIKNTKDTYEITKDGTVYQVKAQIDSSSALSEGYDYILRSAKISLWGRIKTSGDTGAYTNMTSQFKYGSKANNHDMGNGKNYVDVLQKVSKAQSSDTVDGIKYAKDESTYFLADSKGKNYTSFTYGNYSGQDLFRRWSTNMGGITNSDITGGKCYAQEAKLKGDNGYYYVDLGDVDSVDDAITMSMGGGRAFCLAKGYIYLWNDVDAFEKIYKVDGAMNKMSASNKDNIVVYNTDDKVYSVIYNKKVPANGTAAGTGTTATTSAAVGWVKANDSTWSFNKADGTKTTGWFQDSTGTWYFAKADGVMVANGWAQSGSTWYYLGATGAMVTNQWVQSGNDWYYVSSTGAMLTNTVQDGYKLGLSGAWVK